MCFADSERPRFYDMAWRRAKKEHRCCECHDPIPIGARYEYVAGRWDDFADFKTCDRCVRARDRVKAFELAAGCDADEAFCPHRGLSQTLVDHDLTFETVFLPNAQDTYLRGGA